MYIRIKELREKNKLTIKQISEYLNISANLYEAFENGQKEIPVYILSKLAKKYNTSIDYIIGNTDYLIPHSKINP